MKLKVMVYSYWSNTGTKKCYREKWCRVFWVGCGDRRGEILQCKTMVSNGKYYKTIHKNWKKIHVWQQGWAKIQGVCRFYLQST